MEGRDCWKQIHTVCSTVGMGDGLDLGKRKENSSILLSAELMMCFSVRMADRAKVWAGITAVQALLGPRCGRVVRHLCVQIRECL